MWWWGIEMYLLTCAQNLDSNQLAHPQSDQSSLSAWRKYVSLTIKTAPSEDSDQTANMQTDLQIVVIIICMM